MPQLTKERAKKQPSKEPANVVVPLVDEREGYRIYAPAMLYFAVLGGIAGAVVFGYLGLALATGWIAVAGSGQWAAAGAGPTTFAGVGVGLAIGALAGALVVLYRLPRRRPSS